MTSSNHDIRYEEINQNNILLATKIQLEIFPNVSGCGFTSFERAYKKGKPYFIAYYKNKPMGTTGLYEDFDISDNSTVWLGWYGILPDFRGMGLGKTILLDTIAEAQKRGYKTFRLYTSKVLCPVACKMYAKVMDKVEKYDLEEKETKWMVCSKSLCESKVSLWNNRPLFLDKIHAEEMAALKKYKRLLNSEKQK